MGSLSGSAATMGGAEWGRGRGWKEREMGEGFESHSNSNDYKQRAKLRMTSLYALPAQSLGAPDQGPERKAPVCRSPCQLSCVKKCKGNRSRPSVRGRHSG